jgi:hypothetical protein
MRTDCGYDAVFLAMKDKNSLFHVYLLGADEIHEQELFTETDHKKLERMISHWCEKHLPEDRKMVCIPVKSNMEAYLFVKGYLQLHHITYEIRKKQFFITKKDEVKVLEAVKEYLNE